MKILHILDHSLPLHSGYTFRSQNIFRSQKNRGWEPVVLTSPKHEQSWQGPYKDKEVINGFTYYRTGPVEKKGFLPVVPEVMMVRTLKKVLQRVIEIEQPDFIHAHSPFINAMSALDVGRQLGIPVAYEIRAFWEDAAVDHGSYKEGSWKYRLVRFMETRVCKRAGHVFVLCNGLKKDLVQRGIDPSRITPVFNGIDPFDFKPVPPDGDFRDKYGLNDKRILGFIGSFYRYEGLDLLIKSFAELSRNNPDLVLLLVGGGEMEAELRQLVASLDETFAGHHGPPGTERLSSRVLFPGRIPHEQVPGVYSLMDILVYPRYRMRLTDLVTPLKPLEAMAMGKALVASDVGGHRELIRDRETGILFKAGDENDLTRALEVLLNDEDKRQSIQDHASEWVRNNHAWEKTTSVYDKVYSDLSVRE
ncbi:TIGR04063 family PEP-CTERM/XrtA system glycosyltransferase [Desulfonatronovibrio hydrogenovorans]|uniref:TIGR04063 family PEP-CTERM/XrtA system glycosyltransferase n=1 Tax=Desulfonatronovibrio hydrogenovorans TaxID=53245 RepID=UPI000491BAF7|nr:TIGR04063 family PEP-CTERM/XrtA system glycosyltransferase [Desulfonatronovibrio hydrogenovorans]